MSARRAGVGASMDISDVRVAELRPVQLDHASRSDFVGADSKDLGLRGDLRLFNAIITWAVICRVLYTKCMGLV